MRNCRRLSEIILASHTSQKPIPIKRNDCLSVQIAKTLPTSIGRWFADKRKALYKKGNIYLTFDAETMKAPYVRYTSQ